MKDLYELLNEIKIDETDFEEMSVDEVEIARVKRSLKKKIKGNKSKKKSIVAAGLLIACTAVLGSTITTYAEDIPIVRDIFKVMNNRVYNSYKENANEVNITKTYKDTSVTINDAVFNGSTITLTYTIKTNKDLGDEIFLNNYHVIKEYDKSGYTAGSKFIRVDDFTYVGQENITLFNFNEEADKPINLAVKIDGIQELIDEENFINGKWDFNFVLEPVASNRVMVNKQASAEGVAIEIKSIDINPMSMFLVFSESYEENCRWDKTDIELEVKDDLGNTYEIQQHGGTGNGKAMDWSATLEQLQVGSSQLIITPKVTLVDLGDAKLQEVEYKDNISGKSSTTNTETFEALDVKEVILESIIVDIR